MGDEGSCQIISLKAGKKVKVCQVGNELKVEEMKCDVCNG